MNPLPKQAATTAGRTMVVGGSAAPSGPPSFHTHPTTAITGDLSILLPSRLAEQAPGISDCNAQYRSGWWAASTLTNNTPASSFWVGRSIWYGLDTTTGLFADQYAQEIVPPYRTFVRHLNVVTWTAWEQTDRTFYDTRYRLTSAQIVLTTDVTGVLPPANGGAAVPTAWTALPYAANWADAGFGWVAGQYRKVGDYLELRGLAARSVSASGATATIATLPAGFRPVATNNSIGDVYYPAAGGTAASQVYVTSGGAIITSVSVPAGAFVPFKASVSLS